MKSEKTRNNGSMTEAAYFSWIRSGLRKMSMRGWKPIAQVRQEARRPYTGPNKRLKYEYKCAICKEYFPDKEIHVDHICAAGSLKSAKDLEGFVERLFCEKDGLRVLCKPCHHKITHQTD